MNVSSYDNNLSDASYWKQAQAEETDGDNDQKLERVIVPVVFAIVGFFFFCIVPIECICRRIRLCLVRCCWGTHQNITRHTEEQLENNESIIIKTVLPHEEGHNSCPTTEIDRINKRSRCFFLRKSREKESMTELQEIEQDSVVSVVAVVAGEGRTNELEESPHHCSICLEPFCVGESVAVSKYSKCKHIFHKECIFTWLRKKNSCPSCRQSFVSPSFQESNVFCRICKMGGIMGGADQEKFIVNSSFCVVHGLVMPDCGCCEQTNGNLATAQRKDSICDEEIKV